MVSSKDPAPPLASAASSYPPDDPPDAPPNPSADPDWYWLWPAARASRAEKTEIILLSIKFHHVSKLLTLTITHHCTKADWPSLPAPSLIYQPEHGDDPWPLCASLFPYLWRKLECSIWARRNVIQMLYLWDYAQYLGSMPLLSFKHILVKPCFL